MSNNEWERMICRTTIPACRSGWAGVCDAIKAAITGDERLTAPTSMTVSWLQRADGNIVSQVEHGPAPTPYKGKDS
jgi:hypothetical protein